MLKEHDLSEKPGWVRISLHPTMTDSELEYVMDGLEYIIAHADELSKDYLYDRNTNEFFHKSYKSDIGERINTWYSLS